MAQKKDPTTKFKMLSASVPPQIIERADEYAAKLSAVEGRVVSRSQVVALAIELLEDVCPTSELDAEAERLKKTASPGLAGVAVLRSRLRANVAQSVEQRFRSPLVPARVWRGPHPLPALKLAV